MNGGTTVEGHLEVNGKSRPFLVISVRAAAVILVGVIAAIAVFGGVVEYIVHDYVRRIAVSQCEVGNEARTNDLSAWEELRGALGLTNDPRADAFIAKIRKKDQLRVLIGDKCSLPPSTPSSTAGISSSPSSSASPSSSSPQSSADG